MPLNPRLADWNGRRVWLIGASSGIGAALARELARRGARLALSARRADALTVLAIERAVTLTCDVTSAASVARAAASMRATLGGIDLVIYLAGDYVPMRVDDFDLARAERLLDVNYRGALRVCDAVLGHLKPGGGIALVSSVAGYRGLPRALAYGPGKAALTHLAECLAHDLHPRGIGVWVINPGFIATRLTERNDFRMPALIDADDAARRLLAGLAGGGFEIDFPKRFTRVLRWVSRLPYRWYFPLVRRFTGE